MWNQAKSKDLKGRKQVIHLQGTTKGEALEKGEVT